MPAVRAAASSRSPSDAATVFTVFKRPKNGRGAQVLDPIENPPEINGRKTVDKRRVNGCQRKVPHCVRDDKVRVQHEPAFLDKPVT
jgi:hypothetical protein